jgi:hypothetical protein
MERVLTRRKFCIGMAATANLLAMRGCESRLPVAWAEEQGREQKVLVGAIKWDTLIPGTPWPEELKDPNFSDRLPFFAKVDSVGNVVELNGNNQEVVDQENIYASDAGLDYFAYCLYDRRSYDQRSSEHNKFNYGKDLYLKSRANKPNFAVIIQGQHFGGKPRWDGFCNQLVEMFGEDKYQKVLGDRPLMYLYYVNEFNENFQSEDQAKAAIYRLREKSVKAGLGNPYIAAQNASAELVHLGFDAFSFYTANGGGAFGEAPFSALVQANIDYWEELKSQGRQIVPLLNLGWDPRPRLKNPELSKFYPGPWYTKPTTQEIMTHTQRLLTFIRENAKLCQAQTGIIYSWNELAEGGSSLIPTLKEGTARIDAVREVLVGP